MQVLKIQYFSDVLCVWAWIAQARIEELEKEFGAQIEIDHHYLDLFGNTEQRIHVGWKDKGGYDGFSKHVIDAVSSFPEVSVNSSVWKQKPPSTSANAHLWLKASQLVDQTKSSHYALAIREAFFLHAQDISSFEVLKELAEQCKIDTSKLEATIFSGKATAQLMLDQQQAKNEQLKGSPSFILDNGRQILYGNVGYRVLAANVEELLRTPELEASWC